MKRLVSAFRNVQGVARYERMLLTRTMRFRVLGVLGVGIPIFFGIVLSIAEAQGNEQAAAFGLSAFIPFYLYTYIQTVVIAFVAGNFRAADEQAHVDEVVGARPLSTFELVLGKYLGVVEALLGLSLAVMVITVAIQAAKLSIVGLPFSLRPYLAFFGLMTLPGLIYMSALTFFLGALLRNKTAAALLSIAYIIGVLFFLGDRYGGIFDFGAFFAPLFWSDLMGLGDITRLLEQRVFYMALAVMLVGLAVLRYPRLSHGRSPVRLGHGVALAGLVGAVAMVVHMQAADRATETWRQEILASQVRHAGTPEPEVLHYDLSVGLLAEEPLVGRAGITVRNPHDVPLETLVFNLNPGLEVTAVRDAAGGELEWSRDGSVLLVTPGRPLAPRVVGSPGGADGDAAGGAGTGAQTPDTVEIVVEYRGEIDRDGFDLQRTAARLDKSDDMIHKGALTAWIREESAWLPPRSRWYPSPGVDYGHGPESEPPPSFASARLEVDTPAGLQIVTQGSPVEGSVDGGRRSSVWEAEHPVPHLSLNAGVFETFEARVRDVDIALYVHPAHRKNVVFFEDSVAEVQELLDQLLLAMEQETGLPYPYPRLSVVEVPFLVQWYYEGWQEHGGLTQPGVLMVEEDQLLDTRFERDFNRRRRWGRGDSSDPARIKRDLLAGEIFSIFLRAEDDDAGIFRSPLVQLWAFDRGFEGDESALLERGLPVYLHQDVTEEIRDSMFNRDRGRGLGRGRMNAARLARTERDPLGRNSEDVTWDDQLETMQSTALSELDPEANPDLYRAILDTKSVTLYRVIRSVVGSEEFANTMEAFGAGSQFENVSFEEFERAVVPVSAAPTGPEERTAAEAPRGAERPAAAERRAGPEGRRRPAGPGDPAAGVERGERSAGPEATTADATDIQRLVQDWLHSTHVPGYTLTRASARKLDDGWGAVTYQVVVRIRNGEPGRGFVQVTAEGREDAAIKNLQIEGGQEVEVALTTWDRPLRVTVEPFLAKNPRPLVAPLRVPEEAEIAPAEEYVRIVPPDEARFTEIIVDNEDEGFSLPVRRVQRYLRPGLEGGNWAVRTHQFAFGRYETSFRWKSPGDGAQPAVWTARLPHEGEYDVAFYFMPSGRMARYAGLWGLAETFHLTIFHGGEEEQITIRTDDLQGGWNLLGRFRFEAGEEARVELSDRADGRIYADAVRWRWVDPENPNAVYDEGIAPWEVEERGDGRFRFRR